jgi:hypothetical protein
LDQLNKMAGIVPEPSESTNLENINAGGIATLTNGSAWRIAPAHLSRVRLWVVGAEIALEQNSPNKVWPHKLINRSNGEQVSATKSIRPPK